MKERTVVVSENPPEKMPLKEPELGKFLRQLRHNVLAQTVGYLTLDPGVAVELRRLNDQFEEESRANRDPVNGSPASSP